MSPPASVMPRLRRSRPPREQVLQARGERRRRQVLFGLSLGCGLVATVVFIAYGIERGEIPPLTALAFLVPGIALGLVAGPRLWPAYLAVGFVAMALTFADPGGAMVLLCIGVLVLGYAGRSLWSLVTERRVWIPLGPEADRPRSGGSSRADGVSPQGTRDATTASAAPSDRAYRKRWFG